ncbi:hypothetical protein CAJAP_06922 [Camponotus japonicus]
MRYTILALTVALCLAFVSSNPLPENGLLSETVASSGSNFWDIFWENFWAEQTPIIGPTKGMTEAIPGPFTRLLLIANRGCAQWIADCVLRLADISEKYVNYKGKLITWLF